MTEHTDREALTEVIASTYTVFSDDHGDLADAILAEFLPEHDKRVRAEQREQIITTIDASPAVTWTGKGGVRERIAATREASDD